MLIMRASPAVAGAPDIRVLDAARIAAIDAQIGEAFIRAQAAVGHVELMSLTLMRVLRPAPAPGSRPDVLCLSC